jgi:apolipoprotein N-acyltransferase
MNGMLLAAASAALMSLALRPWPCTGYLAWLALVPLLIALANERRVLRAALLAGIAWSGLGWAAYEAAVVVVPWAYPVLVVGTCALWALAGAGTAALARRWGPGAAPPLFAVLVLAVEYVAGQRALFGDLALVARFGYVQYDTVLRSAAAWSGPSAVAFAVLATNAALALALRARRPTWPVAALLAGSLWVVLPTPSLPGSPDAGSPIAVGLVQSAAPKADMRMALFDDAAVDRVMEVFEAHTRELADAGVDLVLWGETVVPNGMRDGRVDARVTQALVAAPTALVGARERFGGVWHNSVLLWENSGFRSVYRKQTLVPLVEGGLTSGEVAQPLALAGRRLALGICLETLYGDLARGAVREGADALVYFSDDTFAGRTVTSDLHMRATAFRAAETGRPTVFVNESGPSAVFDESGRVVAHLAAGASGTLVAELTAASGTTPYVRWGDWIGRLAVSTSLAAFAAAAVPRRIAPRATTPSGHRYRKPDASARSPRMGGSVQTPVRHPSDDGGTSTMRERSDLDDRARSPSSGREDGRS